MNFCYFFYRCFSNGVQRYQFIYNYQIYFDLFLNLFLKLIQTNQISVTINSRRSLHHKTVFRFGECKCITSLPLFLISLKEILLNY